MLFLAMRVIFRDRSFLATATFVLLGLGYAACGPERPRNGVNYAGCVSALDCLADGYVEGSTCTGGYCIGPEVRRECLNDRQCAARGLGACVMSVCQAPPPPVETDAWRPDAPDRDVGTLSDAYIEPIDAFIPTSGST